MGNFNILKVVDRGKGLFTKLGIDYPVMRTILQVKLTMDRRRIPTILDNNRSKNKKGDANQFLKSLWVYGFIGLVLVPFLFFTESYLFPMSIVFGILMFMLMTSMISDFSQVLLDVRDKSILHTRPINKRTINAAKIVHVGIYMFYLTAAITAVPLAVSAFVRGIGFFFTFLGLIILMNMLIIVMTALLYLLILRFFDGEKLKDIINYVQILLSVAIVVGYQLVIRSFELIDFELFFTPQWWHVFLPPVWYGAVFELLLTTNISGILVLFAAMAILLPFLSIYIYIQSIPAFERNLEKLLNHAAPKKKRSAFFCKRIAQMICSDKEERAFYHFARLMMKNERQFKLKVYPTFGFSLIFPFIMIFNELRMSSWEEISSGKSYMWVYFAALMISTIIMMLRYSENAKGAWIYKGLPIHNIKSLSRGTLKAFMIHMYLPVFSILSLALMLVFSVSILFDLIVVFLASSVYVIVCFKLINGDKLFFSEPFEMAQQQDTAKVIASFFLLGAMVGIHFLVSFLNYGIYGYGALLLAINLLLWKKAL
ncbi:hypothetical protein SAMN05421736_105130 [Evansella caseinilytica]|uniref:ABC-2 type transport system permease protein n=1 Tax=Evansella caseinilytica TaxID=1503961 RepID=A0A1H3PNK8_9BACI|nr:hypothetical protein [Evansella caseinilytica]SDZ02626.1 hypothetical protein SAMN05421736_105130 [Evansella caseinilytica]